MGWLGGMSYEDALVLLGSPKMQAELAKHAADKPEDLFKLLMSYTWGTGDLAALRGVAPHLYTAINWERVVGDRTYEAGADTVDRETWWKLVQAAIASDGPV